MKLATIRIQGGTRAARCSLRTKATSGTAAASVTSPASGVRNEKSTCA